MLFNSAEFLVFLAVVLLGHSLLIPARRPTARKWLLLIASYVFYMAWSPPFSLLLLASTVLDFSVGRRMARTGSRRHRRALLVLSLSGNLGVLGYFKYGNFLAENFHAAFGPLLGIQTPPSLDILLPIGISFYTFQSLSYSIDIYRGQQQPTPSLLDFALFVSFFPQLVAGPIVRSRTFLPQLVDPRPVRASDVEAGFIRVAIGMLKKVVFADTLGGYVDEAFAAPGELPGLNLLLATYAYAYQIYFDFSGYSDIAIGLARIFGFRIPENFDRPYLARNPRDFWRRWHITLSTWLRDYVYVSLGGNRQPLSGVYASIAVTMLLGGLWHGASWTFVAWGAYHGVWLILHRIWSARRVERPDRLPRWVHQCATFHLVCLGWIFFRAQSLADAGDFMSGILRPGVEASPLALETLVLVAISAAIQVSSARGGAERRFEAAPPWVQGLGYAIIAAVVFLFWPTTERFIYFQF
jgi:D-alanyl-lipoteichoic acid acyltransferase DltB (MBOAT superfamily)